MPTHDESWDYGLITTGRRAEEIDDGDLPLHRISEPAVIRRIRIGAHESIIDDIITRVDGIGGNATGKVLSTLCRLDRYDFTGIVSVCPYYNRPSQDGMAAHFRRIAGATDRKIVIYNIPYRTGVNLANDTLLALAEQPNIVGVKDSSGNFVQSLELLRRHPPGLAVMTGEDNFYYTMLAHGADGGILASAHIATPNFIDIHAIMLANDHHGARRLWSQLEGLVPLLFREANPMPIKYCLWRQGLLRSPECRLPLTQVSPELAAALDRAMGELQEAESFGDTKP